MANRTVGVRTTRIGILSTSASVSIQSTDGQTLGSGTATSDTTFTANIGDRLEFVAVFNSSSSGSFAGWGKAENLEEVSNNGTRVTYRFRDPIDTNTEIAVVLR